MGLIAEFKTFIVKGNAIDLAVGIIIGAAFGALVKSLVDDVMMPPLGYIMGGVDFSDKTIQLAPAVAKGTEHPIWHTTVHKDIPAVVISYGKFINAVITLLIQGFCVFLIVKGINRLKREEAIAPSAPARALDAGKAADGDPRPARARRGVTSRLPTPRRERRAGSPATRTCAPALFTPGSVRSSPPR